MTAYVIYQAPVWVEVDLEEGTVVDVKVADELVDGPGSVHDEAGRDISASAVRQALTIAEEEPWPAWTIGP